MSIQIVVPPSEALRPDGLRLNRFPVVRNAYATYQYVHAWSIHRVNLAVLPVLNVQSKAPRKALNPHLGSTLSTADHATIKKPADQTSDTIAFVKDNLNRLFGCAMGITTNSPGRVFSLGDAVTNNSDALILVDCVRYDLPCHTFICDAFFVPLTRSLIARHRRSFEKLVGPVAGSNHLLAQGGAISLWKQLIPALAERCRTWDHGPNCEYFAQERIPLSVEVEESPLCSCGAGKNVEGMQNDPLWRDFAPYATRVAISPLFAVSYLERIGRDPEATRCARCRGKGKPKLKICTGCRKIRCF